jgi:hypothetical protein
MAANRKQWNNGIALILFLSGAASFQLIPSNSHCAVCHATTPVAKVQETDRDVQLTRAKEKAISTRKQLAVTKRLVEKGSANQHDLRLADMRSKVALLEYSSLLDPSRTEKNLISKAEVIFLYRSDELAVAKRLYKRRSISKVAFDRAVAGRDVAASNLKAVKSATETQRKIQVIQAAKSRFEIAQKEHEVAQRLFRSDSISRQTMERATSNLKIALAELDASKKALGATATAVQQ